MQTFVPSRLRGRFLDHRRGTCLAPLLLALLVACGDERSSKSPTPIMLAETVLAMSADAIFRYADGRWEESTIDDTPVSPARFLGVTYSDIDTAWAFGEELTLLVSRDDGRSWQSATGRVPPAYREFIAMERENEGALRDLLFTSPSTAFLFALRRYAGSAALQTFPVFVSRDEGMTWQLVEPQNDPKFANAPNPNVFGVRDGTPEILRRFMDARLAVDDLVEPYGSDPIGIPTFDADLFVTSADRGWVAGLARMNGQLSGVLASGRKGAGWVVQDIGLGGDVRLDGMDFREGTRGLACGSATESANEAPFCVVTSDGGESWTRSELPPDVEFVGAPVRTAGDTGIVVASTTDDGVVFLQTTDG